MRALFAVLGAGLALALLMLICGLRARPKQPRPRRTRRENLGISAVRLAGVLAVAAVAGVATRWPVAAILAGLAAYTLPAVIGVDRAHQRALARVEAVAAW